MSAVRFIYAIALGVAAAFVCRDLYVWFAVPLGAPVLSVAHIYGLLLLKGVLVYRYRTQTETDVDGALVNGTFYLALCWGLGAIAAWLA